MRLLTTKSLYRAFPELDHFSDEQCRTFVAAASGDRVARAVRLIIQTILALVTLALAIAGISAAISLVDGGAALRTDRAFILGGTAIMLFAFGSASIVFLLTRDILLRRRIRGVMRSRGSCHECNYGLTGLPITTTSTEPGPKSHAVICPECGSSHPADAALGETIEDAKGTLRFVPSPNAPGRIRLGVVRRFIRDNTKLAASLAIFIVLAVAIPVGGYEYYLRRQAAEARPNILDSYQLQELVASTFPELSDQSTKEDLHPFDRVRLLHYSLDSIPDQVVLPDRRLMWPIDAEQTAFLTPPTADPRYPPEILATIRADAALGMEALTRMGAFDKLDAIAAQPRRLPMQAGVGPVFSIYQAFNTPQGSFAPMLVFNRARIRKAILDGDAMAAATALRTHLRLIGHLATVPDPSTQYAAQLEHAAAINLACHAIDRNRTTASPVAMSALLEALGESPRFPRQSQILQIDGAIARGMIASIFSEPSNIRFGTRSLYFASFLGSNLKVTVGTYSKTVQEYETILAARTTGIDNDRFERPVPILPVPRYAANVYMSNNFGFWFEFADTHAAMARAVPLFIAIERFRLDNKRIPATLDELIPTYIACIPIDPFSGKQLLYKLNPADPAANTPSYAIYSTGSDGVDNGGTFPPPDPNRPLKPLFPDTPLITMPPPAPAPRPS